MVITYRPELHPGIGRQSLSSAVVRPAACFVEAAPPEDFEVKSLRVTR